MQGKYISILLVLAGATALYLESQDKLRSILSVVITGYAPVPSATTPNTGSVLGDLAGGAIGPLSGLPGLLG